MGKLRSQHVRLTLDIMTNFASDAIRDAFNNQVDRFYNVVEWNYTSEIKDKPASSHSRWEAESMLNNYVNDQVLWNQDDVETDILVPSKYKMKVDAVEGPEVEVLGNQSILDIEPFILLEMRPHSVPKSQGRDFQGYRFIIHLVGYRDLAAPLTNQQAYVNLLPAPVGLMGNVVSYFRTPETIIKLKYPDINFANQIGLGTDYRVKEVETLFNYIKSVGNKDINLDMLQTIFYRDYEIPMPEVDVKKRLITRLFNKL